MLFRSDFEHFLKLFDFFKDADFSYEDYIENYNKFIDYILENADEIPEFVEDSQKLLQLLYDCNIITAIEIGDNGKPYFQYFNVIPNVRNFQQLVVYID